MIASNRLMWAQVQAAGGASLKTKWWILFKEVFYFL